MTEGQVVFAESEWPMALFIRALYAASVPVGMGNRAFQKGDMDPDHAARVVAYEETRGSKRIHLDYVIGRMVKTSLDQGDDGKYRPDFRLRWRDYPEINNTELIEEHLLRLQEETDG